MDIVKRLRRVVTGVRGGAIASVVLAAIVACSQLVNGPLFPTGSAVFSLSPSGDDVSRLSPVTVTFTKAPADRTPENLLQLIPAAPGSYAWLGAKTLLFQPDFPGLLRGGTYTAVVPANLDAGVPKTVARQFTVTGKLTVQQVIPGDGDTEVPLGAQVLVQFSRSVAPLTTLAAQPTDQVVTFDPPLHGTGEWLNTSIYRFIPTDLVPTTTYKVLVKKGLTSAADGVLESDFRASFTTISPAVDSIVPDGAWLYGGPWQEVVVTFNQPMDESAARGVSVRNTVTGELVPERATWNDTHTVLTLNPTARMAAETKYVITVDKGVKGARGGVTLNPRSSSFTTVGVPRVKQTFPANGQRDAGRYGVSLQFESPMDPDSFEGKIHVSGISDKDLEGKVYAYAFGLSVSVALEPSQSYTVILDAGAKDVYGQVMGGHTFSFTTGSLPSTVALALPGYQGATFSASTEPVLWYWTTNKSEVTFTLYPLTNSEATSWLHSGGIDPKWGPTLPAIRKWTEKIPDAKDQSLLRRTSLSGGGPLPRGFYFLTTDGQYGSRFPFVVVDTVLVAKTSLDELLVWALDHDTGKPLSGITIHTSSSEAVTDAQGLVTFPMPTPLPGAYPDRRVWLWTDEGRFGVLSTGWQGLSPYQFGLPGEYGARQYVGHVYTDRPIYRPGETVFYKGIVRTDDDAQYSLPPKTGFTVSLRNSRGQEIKRDAVTLDDFGSFNAFLDLPEDAPTGAYYVNVSFAVSPGPSNKGSSDYTFASNSFTVAAFRKPEFQVDVRTDRASYLSGDAIDASATATFFFGGALEGASGQWSAIAEPYSIRPKGFEAYSFTDYDWWRQSVAKDPIRAKGTLTTGAGGVASFQVPAQLNASEGAQRFTVSASVQDQNGQAVGGSTQVTVHPAAVYAGIRAERYVGTQDAESTLRLVTVDTEGRAVGGQPVRVFVYDRQWITTKVQVPGGGRRYQSDVKDVLVTTLSARTASDGTAVVRYTPGKPGQLRLVAEVTDSAGRSARAAAFMWVAGRGFALWQVTNDDSIKLVADKDSYAVGDTAEVLVPAPFAGATALITIERGKIITREVRTFATNSERLRIPIVDRSVPDVFVSVVLYRGPTSVDPVPRYKVGYVELPVSTASRQLNVKITPDRDQAEPRQTVKYTLKVTDHTGKGTKAQVSVAVVDKAVLSLMEDRGPDGMKAFWFERGLAVTTNSSMGNSLDRWNDVVAELPKVGKGGSGAGGSPQPRTDFVNVALWDANVVTNDDGVATVEVTMPDDLTTWHMRARAISGDTLVGEGENDLVSTKPLLVRSALPRFVRVGDNVDLRVLVRNATKTDRKVSVTLKASGVAVSGAATRVATIAPNASVPYVWPATVPSEGTVNVEFDADDGNALSDGIALEFPAYADLVPETMSTGGIVTKETAVEAIYLPKFADTAHGTLGVQVQSALVGSLASELPSFEPWCARERKTCQYDEDTMSIASRVIGTIGVARMEKTNRYDSRITTDLATIVGRQRPDGGFPWCTWAYCESDPNVTGWALFALGEARRDGRSVDSGVASRATAFISSWINRPNNTTEPTVNHHDQDSLLIAALASAGSTSAYTMANATIEQYRTQLANWGRAYLVNALLDSGGKPTDGQVRTLINDLAAATIPSANGNHWEDARISSKYSFMTSTATTALVALATARAMPDHQLLPQSVRWLTIARAAQGWQTNVDRAMSILALATYVGVTGELGAEFAYSVALDQKQVMSGQVKASTVPTAEADRIPLTSVTPGKTSLLSVQRDFGKAGRLYYTLDLRYMTPAKEIDAVNRGFAISHRYTLLGAPDAAISEARLGDVVRVTLTVIAPHDRNYVTIEDMLPAGLEAIDPQLKTTDPGLRAQLEKDRTAAYARSGDKFVAPWYRWYYSPWQQVDVRDDRTILRVDRLTKGMYEYTYYARATTTGDFFVAPAHAEEQFFPEVFGHSDSARFKIKAP